MENQRFEGSRTVFGNCKVLFNGKELDPRLDLFYHARDGFDWGYMGAGPLQLAFAILAAAADESTARNRKTDFAKEVIAKLSKKEWHLSVAEVTAWLEGSTASAPARKKSRSKSDGENVVKSVCKELGITQKKLAQILEVPEGTVSSWAVKNEIPRLGKKAIEFYIQMQKNEEIVKRFREMIALVNESSDSD